MKKIELLNTIKIILMLLGRMFVGAVSINYISNKNWVGVTTPITIPFMCITIAFWIIYPILKDVGFIDYLFKLKYKG